MNYDLQMEMIKSMKKFITEQERTIRKQLIQVDMDKQLRQKEKNLICKARGQLVKYAREKGMTPEDYYYRVASGRRFKYTFEELFPKKEETA